jgi:hypothetical protein
MAASLMVNAVPDHTVVRRPRFRRNSRTRASVPSGVGAAPGRRRTDIVPLLRARQRGHTSPLVLSPRLNETVRSQDGQLIRVIGVSFAIRDCCNWRESGLAPSGEVSSPTHVVTVAPLQRGGLWRKNTQSGGSQNRARPGPRARRCRAPLDGLYAGRSQLRMGALERRRQVGRKSGLAPLQAARPRAQQLSAERT